MKLLIIGIIIGILSLIFIIWWFHLRKHLLLKNRLINNDEILLTDPGLKIKDVFQAPQGSAIYPYIIINEETTRVSKK